MVKHEHLNIKPQLSIAPSGRKNIFLVTNLILLGGPLARMLRGIKNSKIRLRATLKHHQKFQSQPNISQKFEPPDQPENIGPEYFDVPDSFTLAIQTDPIYPEWTGTYPPAAHFTVGLQSNIRLSHVTKNRPIRALVE